jgi:hypothetical protein
MTDETIVEGEATEVTAVERRNVARTASAAATSTASAVRSAAGSLGKAVAGAVFKRDRHVWVRVSSETLHQVDRLVEGEVARNRAEGIAFLIAEGIKANRELFARLTSITDEIAAMRTQVRQAVQVEGRKPED